VLLINIHFIIVHSQATLKYNQLGDKRKGLKVAWKKLKPVA